MIFKVLILSVNVFSREQRNDGTPKAMRPQTAFKENGVKKAPEGTVFKKRGVPIPLLARKTDPDEETGWQTVVTCKRKKGNKTDNRRRLGREPDAISIRNV